jgi:hypothetical protein
MNTYEELKFRQGWTLFEKNQEKKTANNLHISIFCIRNENNFIPLRRFYTVFILKR